jgi:hypothetical protein
MQLDSSMLVASRNSSRDVTPRGPDGRLISVPITQGVRCWRPNRVSMNIAASPTRVLSMLGNHLASLSLPGKKVVSCSKEVADRGASDCGTRPFQGVSKPDRT